MKRHCGEVDRPEVGGGRASAGEDDGAIEVYVDGGGVESGGTTVVAEESNGEEGARGEVGKDVSKACRWWKVRDVECGGVCGVDGVAVWEEDGDARVGERAVGVW